ncbi:guanylate kinase [Streptomyces sp. 8N706]|uniref:guanylate kinase n=1 Tax=Streptomyces sp. 8N706 TaxID=3457416 RepID=UPI003FD54852
MNAVVIYGPPTAGKDTVTSVLTESDSRFQLLTKLKQGTGRSAGYRFVNAEELDALRAQNRIIVETHRYGNIYAVDRHDLDDMRSRGQVPIVHIGNMADLRKLLGRARDEWLRVLLWVPRGICAERSRMRGDRDAPDRLRAWDETQKDLLGTDGRDLFDLILRTDQVSPRSAADAITTALLSPTTACTREELHAAMGSATSVVKPTG